LLGSLANADAQNASASTAHAHRTDQPQLRLSLVFIAVWILLSPGIFASSIKRHLGQRSDVAGQPR
jgi:hypothetical protein